MKDEDSLHPSELINYFSNLDHYDIEYVDLDEDLDPPKRYEQFNNKIFETREWHGEEDVWPTRYGSYLVYEANN